MKPLMGAAAVAALCCAAPPGASAESMRCSMKYANGNTMEWTFVEATEDKNALAELSYSKNGEPEQRYPSGKLPYWTIQIREDTHVVALSSRVDPGYVLGYYISPSPDAGGASMFHDGVKTAEGVCARLDPPAPAPAPAPTYEANASANIVPYTMSETGGMIIPVMIGSHPVDMLVDTGATISAVNETLADELIASGEATDANRPSEVVMADNRVVTVRNIWLKSLQVGTHTRVHVLVSVNPAGAANLIGLPVLNAIGRMTIDSSNHRLIFG
jgi:hypothetical protein